MSMEDIVADRSLDCVRQKCLHVGKEANLFFKYKSVHFLLQGKLMEAIQMDVDDIRGKFGNKYDDAIKQILDYADTLNPDDVKKR